MAADRAAVEASRAGMLADLRSMPRERIAAAVADLRSRGLVPSGRPIPGDVGRWSHALRGFVLAAAGRHHA